MAQQLAKWRGAPKEAAALLGPLCSSLFQGDSSMEAELREDFLKGWLHVIYDLVVYYIVYNIYIYICMYMYIYIYIYICVYFLCTVFSLVS